MLLDIKPIDTKCSIITRVIITNLLTAAFSNLAVGTIFNNWFTNIIGKLKIRINTFSVNSIAYGIRRTFTAPIALVYKLTTFALTTIFDYN